MDKRIFCVEVGGTFTDWVLVDDGRVIDSGKVLSTPDEPARGVMNALCGGLTDIGEVSAVIHGSTVATNAVLEGKGARTGMVTTAGFKYVLEIARHDIPRKENLFGWVKPAKPVRPYHIMEVPERVLLDGTVATPLERRRRTQYIGGPGDEPIDHRPEALQLALAIRARGDVGFGRGNLVGR